MNAKIIIGSLTTLWLTIRTAAALDLVMTFDDSVPYIDRQGVDRTQELVGVVEAAKSIWEDIIEDEVTVECTYGWADVAGSALGTQGARISFDTQVDNGGPSRLWFIDSTPLDHSEFDFSRGQSLVRDADTDPGWFTGDVPGLLEIGYVGRPTQFGRGFDLLSVALHEIGHWLGVRRFDAYDIKPDFVGGAIMGIKANTGHLLPRNALMHGSLGYHRELPSAADVLAAASNFGWTQIDLPRQDFLGRDGDVRWTSSLNWVGNQVPGARDDVYLRHGGTVRLAAALTEIQRVADLFVEDGTELVIDGLARLNVEADPRVWDSHGKVLLRDQGKIEVASTHVPALTAREMEIAQGGTLSLAGGTAWIFGDLTVGPCGAVETCDVQSGVAGMITGYGKVQVGSRLINGGRIEGRARVSNPAERTLAFVAAQRDEISWHLSGSASVGGPGFGQVVASQGDVRFSGGRAAPFEGQMLAENGYSILFDTATLSSAGQLSVRDASSFIFAPRIENSGQVELFSGGRLHTLQFQNAGGSIRGDGRIVFTDSFTNEGGHILADQGQTLALAATARIVQWDLAGNLAESLWHARNGGTIRFGAAAAEAVQFDTFGGALSAENGGSIEFEFANEFALPIGPSGSIDIVGTDSILTASRAALMIGVTDDPLKVGTARTRVDQGRMEANAIYVGGDKEGSIAEGLLELRQGEVFASSELVVWPTGRIEGVGTMQADVVNFGTLAGNMEINGTYSQGPAGVLAMEIVNAHSYDRLVIDGHASLDGTLELTFRERPSIGERFDLMDFWSVSGSFGQIVMPPHVQAEFTITAGELVVTAVAPEPTAVRLLLLCYGGFVWRRKIDIAGQFH